MNRIAKSTVLVSLALIAIAAMSASAMAATITPSFVGDVSYANQINGTLNSSNSPYNGIFYFPFTLEALNDSGGSLYLNITCGSNGATFNLTINGNTIVTNYSCPANTVSYTNLTLLNNSISLDTNYMNITIDVSANSTTATWLNITGTDVPLSGGNFSFTTSETNLSDIYIGFYPQDTYYTVRDTITVTQNSSLNLTNVTATYSYPSNALNSPETSHSFGTLNTSQSKSDTVDYQKQGPYVGAIQTKLKGTTYTTTMDIYAPEAVNAYLSFDPSEKPWSKYFAEFNKSNIVSIELNDVDVDWTDPPSTVTTETMTLTANWNELVVTYTKPTAPSGPVIINVEETPWYMDTFLMVPIYIWIIVVVAAVLVGVYMARG